MRFAYGDAVAPLKVIGDAPAGKKGTKVTFLPSTEKAPGDGGTFKNHTEFDFEKLEHRYRELAFLNSGVRRLGVEMRRVDGGRPAYLLVRSEEHTSELQSLMSISYDVFCLQTPHHIKTTPSTPHH